jgi:TorA maturation chaperone TorD
LTLATVAHSSSEAPLVAASDEVDLARARYWQLLGLLLRAAPDDQTLALVGGLEGDTSPLGSALSDLATAARATDSRVLEREYHHLFIGVGRGELLPYGSFYLTGFLHEKPLARLRADLAKLGIVRAPGQTDPEDHIAALAEVMAGLIAGDFRVDGGTQERFFSRHLAPWAGRSSPISRGPRRHRSIVRWAPSDGFWWISRRRPTRSLPEGARRTTEEG